MCPLPIYKIRCNVYNKTIEKNGTAQRAERKITMKQFEIGKTYTMASPCDRNCVWTYTVTKRTAKTITISDGTETKTCRVNAQVSEDRNAETVFPMGRYSMCPALSADKEEMPEVQEPAEEAEAEAKVITLPRKKAMIKWVKVDQKTGERAKRGCNSLMPHDYVAIAEHLRIENHSFAKRKGAWVLTTHKGSVIEKFDTLKAAKAYAETLA